MKTILLIDKELENLWGYMEILYRQGYKVVAAPDGRSAMSFLRGKSAVDLVIADYGTQGINGPEFFINLTQISLSVPVLMLSSPGIAKTQSASLSSTMFEHVNKPIKAKELLRVVKKTLEHTKNITLSPRRILPSRQGFTRMIGNAKSMRE